MTSILASCKYIISYGLYLSFKIGQFLVTTANSALVYLAHFLNKLTVLLTIILEDFVIFLQDLIQRINTLLGLTSYLLECIANGGFNTLLYIKNLHYLIWTVITTVFESLLNGVLVILKGVGNTFVFIKHTIILFGDGVWFIVIFIPKSILALIPLTLNHLSLLSAFVINYITGKTAVLYNLILDLLITSYVFITDVPLESLIGIIIAGCFMYIFLQFYTILKMYFRAKFLIFLRGSRLHFNQLKRMLKRALQSRLNQFRPMPIQFKASSSCDNSNKVSDNRYCVICQDRLKCILILPCKHLCLCNECIDRLMYYTGSCPICRKRINRTMKVFT